jgi:hypothetical protein
VPARRGGRVVGSPGGSWSIIHGERWLAAGLLAHLSDDGMMAVALRQARSCGFRTFYWAHDAQSWAGTMAFESYSDWIAPGSK